MTGKRRRAPGMLPVQKKQIVHSDLDQRQGSQKCHLHCFGRPDLAVEGAQTRHLLMQWLAAFE